MTMFSESGSNTENNINGRGCKQFACKCFSAAIIAETAIQVQKLLHVEHLIAMFIVQTKREYCIWFER